MNKTDALAIVLEAASSYADDLETGLDDGTYEDGDPDRIREAVILLEEPDGN
jgi:hypothetical protein